MAYTILPCECPCVTAPDPCGCPSAPCPCLVGVKIYADIVFSFTGYGNSEPPYELGIGVRNVAYTLDVSNNLTALVDISGTAGGAALECPACSGQALSGDATTGDGFLTSDYDSTQVWEVGAGTECPPTATDCAANSSLDPTPIPDGCPLDVCLGGLTHHISSSGTFNETNFQVSNCIYDDGGGDDDHYTEYFCNKEFGPYPGNDPTLFSAAFAICPETSIYSLELNFGNGEFIVSTSPSTGTLFGSATINGLNSKNLYISYPGPDGLIGKSISGGAVVDVEITYGDCPP